MDLKRLIHLTGPGDHYKEWNNTGVHRNFAVAAGPVYIPLGWSPVAKNSGWKIYRRDGLLIATHTSKDLGLLCLFHKGEAAQLLEDLTQANTLLNLRTRFRWPSGPEIVYDVLAEKDQWVIVSVAGKLVDRDHGKWPLMSGDLPGWDKATH
ncbi:hypothetical protein IIB79_05760 [candidate division KSB1 bacterium]|nr:hypothetical protein [candidate division KSB1 bacterium]